MSEPLQSFIDNEVKELKKIPPEEFYANQFHRDPLRVHYIDSSLLFSPADGVLLYQKEVGPEEEIIEVKGKKFSLRNLLQNDEFNSRALVIGIFLSSYDVHISRVPLGGHVLWKKLDRIETANRPMLTEENDILKGVIDYSDMEYSFSNERYLETVIVNKYSYRYHLVTIADKEIDVVSHFKPSGTPMLQNARLASIRFGSQICLVMPLPAPFDYKLLVPNYYHVKAGIDPLILIHVKVPHVEVPVEKNKQELLLKAFNELYGFVKTEKAWQLKSGKWHDNVDGQIVEVDAPGHGQSEQTEKPKSYGEKLNELINNNISEYNPNIKKIKLEEYKKIKPILDDLRNVFLDKIKNYNVSDNEDKRNVQIAIDLSMAMIDNKPFSAKYGNNQKIDYDPDTMTLHGEGYFPSDLIPYDIESEIDKIKNSPEIEKERQKSNYELYDHLEKLNSKKELWQMTQDEANTPITYSKMGIVTQYEKEKEKAKTQKHEWLFRGYDGNEKTITFNNETEARKYAKENNGDVFVLGEERDFYRSGNPPESGRSFNHMDNKPETGVSVYVTPSSGSMAGGEITHYGKGRQIDTGGDDEPVIIITNLWKKYKGHKKEVEQAILQGKKVPDNVLNGYPDLKKKHENK